MRVEDIPIYDVGPDENKSFRTQVIERIGNQMGSCALADVAIAFESVASNSTQEELDTTLAEFRETERLLAAERSKAMPVQPVSTNQLHLF